MGMRLVMKSLTGDGDGTVIKMKMEVMVKTSCYSIRDGITAQQLQNEEKRGHNCTKK